MLLNQLHKKQTKNRERLSGILLGTLDASLLGNIMAGKGIVTVGMVCVGYGSEMSF